jgi:predicted outer membrane repeat protein
MNDLNPSQKMTARPHAGCFLAHFMFFGMPAAFIPALLMLVLAGGATASAQVVTNTADSGPGTLRSAITNAASGAVITFDPSLSGATITLGSTLTINTNLTIDASALPGGLQINGNGSVQIVNVASNITVFLNSLTITRGQAGLYGGGIDNGGTLTLNNCTLSGNSATEGGGGIYSYGTLTLNQCTLSGNSTSGDIYSVLGGGGIYNLGTLALNQCTLSGNSAEGAGGGILNEGTCTLTMNQCTLTGNSGPLGGGIHSGGTLTLNQCTLSGNTGGGIRSGEGPLTMTNTIVSGNYGADIVSNGGAVNYGGSNLVQSVSNSGGTITGPAPITSAPDLAPLGNYGGPTQTMPPLPGSPAIGAGSVAANTFSTDQRGYPRTQNGLIDLGAVESLTLPPFTATPTSGTAPLSVQFKSTNVDSNGSAITGWNWSFGDGTTGTGQNPSHVYSASGIFSPFLIVSNSLGLVLVDSGPAITVSLLVTNTADSGPGTLRSAINNANNGAIITFAPNLSGATITLASTLTINENLTIDASALPGGLQINGNGSVQIFNVASTTVFLNSLTITNAYSSNSGGGIGNSGILTLNNCTLSGNSASGSGGGICNDYGGSATLNQCTLSGNSAGDGNGGGIFNDGTLTLNQCTLSGNSAPGGGGGICNYYYYYYYTTLAMNNTIVAGNSGGVGADIYNYSATLTYGGSNLVQSVNNSGTITGPAPLTNAPDLAPLGNYGGPTQTMPSLPGSPAIGAGSVAANTFTTDQRGYPRTQNSLIDIGAVELQSPAANPPVLGNISVPAGEGNGLQFTFTNAPAADYTVLTATNVSLALTNWTVLGEVQQVAPGQYQFTDPQAATNMMRFYRVRSP